MVYDLGIPTRSIDIQPSIVCDLGNRALCTLLGVNTNWEMSLFTRAKGDMAPNPNAKLTQDVRYADTEEAAFIISSDLLQSTAFILSIKTHADEDEVDRPATEFDYSIEPGSGLGRLPMVAAAAVALAAVCENIIDDHALKWSSKLYTGVEEFTHLLKSPDDVPLTDITLAINAFHGRMNGTVSGSQP
jgi:hypothetical protein